MDIAKSKLQRQMYLRRLHEKGCDELHPCRILEVGRELGWDDATTDEIENFLEAEGLVRFPAFGEVCITHPGQLEVERVIFESNQSSEQLVSGTPPSMIDSISNRETMSANAQARSKVVPVLLFVLGMLASEHPGRRAGIGGQAILVDNVPGE